MSLAIEQRPSLGTRIGDLASDIKLSHSIFAMPWALLSMCLAAQQQPRGLPYVGQIVLIVVCMILARTVAMAANRLLDARLDALNPRTARRAIPAGRLSSRFVTASMIACGIAFVGATSMFGFAYDNYLPLIFSVPVLLFISAYPFLKRFTRLCHYYLGACLALAPICAWIAIAGKLGLSPFLMAGAVLCWTAGFDIIYACQDFESDRGTGVFSVPAKFGIGPALWIARLTHVGCIMLLIALGMSVPRFGPIFFCAVAVVALLLLVEHAVVKPDDLSKVNLAFFTINGVISLLVGAMGIVDLYT